MKHTLFFLVLLLGSRIVTATVVDSLENALKTAEGDKKVKVMNELFRAYINSDPVKAIGYTREALDLATSINDQKGMAASYNNIGISYKNQGALDMALENYMKSADIYASIQNGEGIATTKNNIANIYMLKKDYSQALKYFEESHSGFIALGNPERIIGSMNNLGNLHADLQLYDQALNYYTEAYKLSEKSGLIFADPLTNIGNLFYRQNNFQRAVEYYQRSLDIAKKQNDRISELALVANIGEVYTKAGQGAEAQKYLDQAMALATELNASFYLPQILRSSATNYSKQGKMKEAYQMMVKYDDAREKVYGEESSKRIAQMDVALELQEREKQVDALEADDKIKTLRLRNTQIVITAIVIAIVALLAFANLVYLRKRIRTAR
ncbi:MAG: tetratricopeptide repeat protein [Bacteroidota bacterium]